MSSEEWKYEPAPDLSQSLAERLQSFPRAPHLWMYALRSFVALLIRAWLALFHRFEVRGREHLGFEHSMILVANHQSHLDAACLTAAMPLAVLHRTFPAAASDYFFSSLPRSAFSSIVVNGLPFDREAKGAESLEVCRRLLANRGNILIIFPEGTRSATGELGRFRSGIGRLVEGTNIAVVPCHLEGAHAAFPKGALFPRPKKVVLTLGAPRRYGDRPVGRETVEHICADLRGAVAELAQPEIGVH